MNVFAKAVFGLGLLAVGWVGASVVDSSGVVGPSVNECDATAETVGQILTSKSALKSKYKISDVTKDFKEQGNVLCSATAVIDSPGQERLRNDLNNPDITNGFALTMRSQLLSQGYGGERITYAVKPLRDGRAYVEIMRKVPIQ